MRPLRGEVLDVAHHARPAAEEVGVERHDAIGLVEVVLRVERRAEGGARRRLRGVAVDRLVLMPGRLRILGQQSVISRASVGEVTVAGEDAQPGALLRLLRGQQLARARCRSCAQVCTSPTLPHHLRAIGIVEPQHRRLREARRWRRGWRDGRDCPRSWSAGPSWLSTSRPVPTPSNGMAVAKNSGTPGTMYSGALTYGKIVSVGCLRAGADAGQRQRGAHQLEEGAPAHRIEQLRRLIGKLLLEKGLELLGVGQLVEAAPVLLAAAASRELGAQRRQVEGRAGLAAARRGRLLVGGDAHDVRPSSRPRFNGDTRCSPGGRGRRAPPSARRRDSAASSGGCQAMLKTSERGRRLAPDCDGIPGTTP